MRKALIAIICFAILLPLSVGARDEVEITQESFFVSVGFQNLYVNGAWEIKNTAEHPIRLDFGDLEIQNKEGTVIDTSRTYQFSPPVLMPGETGYAFQTTEVAYYSDPSRVGNHSIIINASPTDETINAFSIIACGAEELPYGGGGFSASFLTASFENTTDHLIWGYDVTIAAYDEAGKMLFAQSIQSDEVAIPSQIPMTVRTRIQDELYLTMIQENRVASVKAIAHEKR